MENTAAPSSVAANERILLLRTLVGFLGEHKQYRWWDTAFLDATGLYYLGINYPRTAFAAGLNSVVAAACRLHDARIGQGRIYHLFRLPFEQEEDLHVALQQLDYASLREAIVSKEVALDELRRLAPPERELKAGPVHVQVGDDFGSGVVSRLAGYYLEAFEKGVQTFPYFVLAS